MTRTEEIKQGILSFPQQILDLMKEQEEESIMIDFFNTLWHNYLLEKQIDTITESEKFTSIDSFNNLLAYLSKAGWITSSVDSNYAFIILNESKLLKWVTKEDLIEVKRIYKFQKYRLKHDKSTTSDKVKFSHKTVKSGLIRKGFAKAGNNSFKYDVELMLQYLETIAINVCKGLTDSIKDVTYEEVICELLAYYSCKDASYTLGQNISDSRGRAIFNALKKIFNPISSKDARALLIVEPQYLSTEGMEQVFASITELLGKKVPTYHEKIRYGAYAYDNQLLPEVDLQNEPDELHKLLWIKRLYNNLDIYDGSNWTTPIEIDK